MNHYLKETNLIDYTHPSILQLVRENHWKSKEIEAQIREIYAYVRDEIKFGNLSDDIPASQVLKEGYGQCNTRTTLLIY